MKRIYLLLLTILTASAVWSQTTRRWVGPTNGSWTTANNWLTGAGPTGGTNGIPQTSDIVLFNDGTTRIITGVPTITLGALKVSNGSVITLTNTTDNRTITVENSAEAIEFSVDLGSSLTLANGGTTDGVSLLLRNNRDVVGSIAGTLIVDNARAFNANGSNQLTTVTGIINNRGTVSDAATKLVFAAGGKYIHAINGGNIPAASWDKASDCSIEGYSTSATRPGNLDQSFGNFIWNSPAQTQQISFAADIVTIKGDLKVMNTGTGEIRLKNSGGGTTATAVQGSFIQTGGTFVVVGDEDTHNLSIAGNFNMSNGTFRKRNGAGNVSVANVIFNGTTEQQFIKTGGTITDAVNFTINNGAIVNFGTSVLNGSTGTFTLSAGGKIISANANGLGATGSIQVTGAKSFNSGADYEFQGANTGVFSTTTDPQVRNFTVKNTTAPGNVTLSKAMTVNGVLALTNGYLTTTTNLLTVGAAGSSTNANGAFVNGPLAKVFTAVGSFPFYVGTVSGGLRTISATTVTTAGATSTTFTARFFNSKPKLAYPGATLDAGIEAISGCEYWTLDRSTGGTKFNASVTLSWNAASKCSGTNYITDLTTLRVLRHSTTPNKWNNHLNTATTGNAVAGTITSNTVTSFSPFAIGTTNADANPLPVVFGDVKAYEKSGSVHVEWSNLTEKDVAEYTIERSANGKDFTAIAKQWPTSNQNDKATYASLDAAPGTGANYYRIKAVETTGKIVYSKILSVNLGKANFGLQLYPNPVVGNQVTVSLSNIKHGKYNLRVVNTTGQDIFKQVINNQSASTTQTLDLPSSVKPGVYRLIITGENYRDTKTFIVQ